MSKPQRQFQGLPKNQLEKTTLDDQMYKKWDGSASQYITGVAEWISCSHMVSVKLRSNLYNIILTIAL